MTRIILPDFALILLFGEGTEADRAPFGDALVVALEDVATRLAARQPAAVNVAGYSKDDLRRLTGVAKEAFARVYAIALRTDAAGMARRLGTFSVDEMFHVPAGESAALEFIPVSTDRRHERGPFDIIGDVHGCADELIELLAALGYGVTLSGERDERHARVTPPPGRRAFFAGDLVDRGPNSPDVLRIVMAMVEDGSALCVAGNHDVSCLRWLEGRHTSLTHGLQQTADQFASESAAFRERVRAFIAGLKGHLWVDGGALAVAHAGVLAGMIGRSSGRVRAFSLYGDTESKPAADGLPTRYHWALEYAGPTAVVYGHTPVADVGWVNNTLCIDTGCCFGGRLTALRWPEREVVSVAARETYAVCGRAFGHPPGRVRRG